MEKKNIKKRKKTFVVQQKSHKLLFDQSLCWNLILNKVLKGLMVALWVELDFSWTQQ